ncbi:hypothetical protein CYMTET_43712 [Cymbomonas tetramitiformis]|uniref:Secreted protein n=1 Tax=Cymbomonas tetramitiformis TaxID=36881 RepID=A0AAE0C3J9_9CHLO|nr:hypothetical protein CYMTET_43712 [Cymbomonas tetramitiformis]
MVLFLFWIRVYRSNLCASDDPCVAQRVCLCPVCGALASGTPRDHTRPCHWKVAFTQHSLMARLWSCRWLLMACEQECMAAQKHRYG